MTEQLGWNHPRAALYEDYSGGKREQRWVHVDQCPRSDLEHIFARKFTSWGCKVPNTSKLTDRQLADRIVKVSAAADRILGA